MHYLLTFCLQSARSAPRLSSSESIASSSPQISQGDGKVVKKNSSENSDDHNDETKKDNQESQQHSDEKQQIHQQVRLNKKQGSAVNNTMIDEPMETSEFDDDGGYSLSSNNSNIITSKEF
jgi:hypothetical protein